MGLVVLLASRWGYQPPGTNIRLFPDLLRIIFEEGGAIENFNIYSKDETIDLRGENILDEDKVRQVVEHVNEKLLPEPSLYGAALGGFFKFRDMDGKWLNFAIQKPHFWLGAEDCVSIFLRRRNVEAADNVTQLLKIATSIGKLEPVKELLGLFYGRITFFLGEPLLLYRPKLLKSFEKGHGYEDAVEPFWKMYRTMGEIFPHDEVLDLLKASSVEFRELGGGKILARFCRALDEVEVDGKEVFRDVGKIVDRVLKERGIRKEW
jgi:hypothetical protein